MRKLVVLGAVLAALAGADLAAKAYAQGRIEDKARAEAGADARVDADIDSFPFLGRLLAQGRAGDVRLSVRDLTVRQLTFARVRLDLRGVEVDSSRLVGDRKVELTDIDRGTLTVWLSAAELSRRLGYDVRLREGAVEATVAGRTVSARPSVSGGSLRLSFGGVPDVSVPIPQSGLVACAADSVAVDEGEVRLSCTLREVPPALVRAASELSS